MTTFKEGQRILYTGKSTEWVTPKLIGRQGEFLYYSKSSHSASVLMDGEEKPRNVFITNLELVEYSNYDPNQNGDTNDDI